jgi:hypothetical protein
MGCRSKGWVALTSAVLVGTVLVPVWAGEANAADTLVGRVRAAARRVRALHVGEHLWYMTLGIPAIEQVATERLHPSYQRQLRQALRMSELPATVPVPDMTRHVEVSSLMYRSGSGHQYPELIAGIVAVDPSGLPAGLDPARGAAYSREMAPRPSIRQASPELQLMLAEPDNHTSPPVPWNEIGVHATRMALAGGAKPNQPIALSLFPLRLSTVSRGAPRIHEAQAVGGPAVGGMPSLRGGG